MPLAACRPPLGAGTDTEVGTRPCPRLACLPYYFRSPKFLPRPRSLSQGPPGSWSSKAEHQLPVQAPTPTPAARGDGPPTRGASCVPSRRMRAGSASLDQPSLAHPVADVESRVPQHPVGLVMLSCPGDSPTSAPKTGSAARVPSSTWG